MYQKLSKAAVVVVVLMISTLMLTTIVYARSYVLQIYKDRDVYVYDSLWFSAKQILSYLCDSGDIIGITSAGIVPTQVNTPNIPPGWSAGWMIIDEEMTVIENKAYYVVNHTFGSQPFNLIQFDEQWGMWGDCNGFGGYWGNDELYLPRVK